MIAARARVAAGAALILLALVGVLSTTRRFDRSVVARDVPAGADAWRPDAAAGGVRLPLGAFALPAPGVLRVVVCPTPLRDPRARLEVRDHAGRVLATERLTEDEARGKRCFDAAYRTDRAARVAAFVLAPAASARAIRQVEAQASRRITPAAIWPALTMLLGFVLIAHVPRRRDAELPLPHGSVGAGPPPSLDPPDGLAPDAEARAAVLHDAALATRARAPVDWNWSPALALAVYLLLHVVMTGVGLAYVAAAGTGAIGTGLFFAVTTLVQHGLLILAAAWFLGAFGAPDPRAVLGLVPTSRRAVARAVGIGLGLVVVAVITTRFIRDISGSPLGRMLERVPVRYAIGFAALLAPLSEELFFRGVLVRAFGKRSMAAGVVGGAVVFTLAHAMQLGPAWIGLVPIAAVALVNGWLRASTGGITQPWIVHTVYNAVLSMGMFTGG